MVKLVNRMARSCALLILFASCVASPGPATAAPGPVWSISASSYPTGFARGATGSENSPPGYLLIVTNEGSGPTNGAFTITDTLPDGLSFSTAAGGYGLYGGQKKKLVCNVLEQTVSCTGGEPSLQSGESAQLVVPVTVAPGSPDAVLNEAAISGGGAEAKTASTQTMIDSVLPRFGFLPGMAGFTGAFSEADGLASTQAGSHPYQFHAGMGFPTRLASGELLGIGGGMRDLSFELPPGVAVNPRAVTTRCTESEFEKDACPDPAQVGVAALSLSLFSGNPVVESAAIYAMVPPPGVPVEFGLKASEGVYVHLLGRVSDDEYRLSTELHDVPAKFPILGAQVTLWGRPSDESHDHVRGSCIHSGGTCSVEPTNAVFLTLPGACGAPLSINASVDSWIEPGRFDERRIEGSVVEGCDVLSFDPEMSIKPTTALADSPTGFEVHFHLPQRDDSEGLAGARLRDAQVTLSEGLVVNPSAANGLGACSERQVGLATGVGQIPVRFTSLPATCPDNAKIGTAKIGTPILERPLTGAVYLAEPFENPFGSLLAAYVTIDDPTTGIVAKFPVEVTADFHTGQVALRLAGLPQLPVEDVTLDLFQGPRSVLKTSLECGPHTITADLTPWSSPEGAKVALADTFVTDIASGGGICPAGEAQAPNRPTFSAGPVSARAGAFSPFVLRLSREDGSQPLASVGVTLPPGVTGRLTGVSICSDAQVANVSCSPASEVGAVNVAAGAGTAPLHLRGRAYLAGPYKGAPLSLALVIPVRAGPLDLGTVVTRVALHVDIRSAQIRAVSDQLPTILDGIPLDLRSIEVDLNRPDFALNPTSCESMAITGSTVSAAGQAAALSSAFQVGGCAVLPFKPKLSLTLSGAVGRGGHPAVRAVYRGDSSGAAASGIGFTLPAGELLDLHQLGRLCPRDVGAERCPGSSRLGSLRIDTPMLAAPLEGPIYLRVPSRRLPDLTAEVRSGGLRFLLRGRVTGRRGRLGVSLGSLPDVPLSKAVLKLPGGRRGLVVNSESLCRARRGTATAHFSAHSGKQRSLRLRPQVVRCSRKR